MKRDQTPPRFITLGININRLLITFIPSILFLGVGIITGYIFGIKPTFLLRDLADIAKINPLYGFFSTIGSFFWFAAASVCLFSAITLRQLKSKVTFDFLMYSGILSVYMAFDDMLLFHDYIAPIYLNIPEKFILAFILVAFIVYLLKFYKSILATNYQFFVLSIFFFSISQLVDMTPRGWLFGFYGNSRILSEEVPKWLGITSWLSYFCYYCYDLFLNILGKGSQQSDSA
jgi:hypothetical protein